MNHKLTTHRDLTVYQTAVDLAVAASRLAQKCPKDERSLREQLRRAGRSPGACLAEAWRKHRYPRYWRNKLSDGQGEAGEAQWWAEVARVEGYCSDEEFSAFFEVIS